MPTTTTDAHRVLDAVIAEHQAAPINILGLRKHGESAYLNDLRASYRRTVDDVIQLGARLGTKPRILELGAYLGVVSVTLKRLGYDVTSADIPEFHRSPSLQAFYARNDIQFDAINLMARRAAVRVGVVRRCHSLRGSRAPQLQSASGAR